MTKTPEIENENFGTENIRPVSDEEKTLMFLIKQRVINYRLNSRQKLLGNPINLATVVAFLPLALGFSQFLSDTSRFSKNGEKTSSFFEKNLPVFTHFKPKLTFETFEYISKSNSRVYANETSTNFIFGQSNYGVTIKKPNPVRNKKFNGLSSNFYFLISSKNCSNFSSMVRLARNLDDLPAYVQGLKKVHERTPNVENYSKNQETKTEFLFASKNSVFGCLFETSHDKQIGQDALFSHLKSGTSQASQGEHDKKDSTQYTKTISSTSKLTPKLKLVNCFKKTSPKTESSNLLFDLNPFYKDRLEFYNDKIQFNTELQTAFTEKHISCVSNDSLSNFLELNRSQDDLSLLNLVVTQNSEVSDEFIIETLLQELEKSSLSEDLPNFRFMSGYNYPDMTSEELYWFYLVNPRKRARTPKISVFDPLPASSRHFSFNVKKFPDISIETHQVSLRNSESNNIFYKGPTLVLDSSRALDWKTNSKQNFRSWFNTYVSPLNPLQQPFENFFGVYNSPKLVQAGQSSDFSDFANTSLFSSKATNCPYMGGDVIIDALEESVVQFSPSSLSFQFISNNEAPKNSLIRTLKVNLSKNNETDQFLTLPVLQIPHLLSSSGTAQSETLENYSRYFTFTSKGNPDYQFSTDSFATKNFVKKYTSGSYTKTASVYSKTRQSTHLHVDNWEPLTSTWWLIVTQISFAFFIFQVLKSLADNYGRELLGYLLDLIASLGFLDDSLKQEIEILLGQRDKGFRVVLNSQKNFTDIVGIQKLLPEIYEVVWFLRNSARNFSLSKTLPRGILLTGPPGTGKTLLVQALAGEAQVPVVVLSGSSLIEPGESGAVKLEKVFQEARDLAPCIVFIDEIDTLAQKRNGVVQNPMGPDELVELLTSVEKTKYESPFEKLQLAREKQEREKEGDKIIQNNSQEEHLSLLTQFLIELDGIQGRDGVIVIGATNRPEVLDPALLRPGRLEKIIQVGLPGHKKRVEILQFYGQGLGYETLIPWNYLGDRTAGFTAADLATLMNESTIKAILNKTKHTIETIEHGIDRLTTSESEKYTVFKTQKSQSLTIASKMSILRLAYYQAGKIVLSSLLETHPKSVVASLWPRRPTIRSAQIATNLQNSIFEFARRCEITDRLVGCYAGKAAEILFIQQFSSSKYAQLSTLGFEDLLFAQKLVYCILEKWSFYSKKSHIQQTTHLASNINIREFSEMPEKLDLYTGVVETIEIPPIKKALETETSSLESKKKTGVINWNEQTYYAVPWWQQQISFELEFVEKNFTNWSRFYLSNPEQNDRNPEWVPSDEFYHSSSGLKNVKKAFANIQNRRSAIDMDQNKEGSNFSEKNSLSPNVSDLETEQALKLGTIKQRFLPKTADFSWNEISLLTRDYPGHSLILQSFNKALSILNQNREFFDRLVVELLYKEILRQPEIEELVKEFDINRSISQEEVFVTRMDKESPAQSVEFHEFEKKKKQKVEILEPSWGPESRKPTPRWIDFAQF